MTLPLRRRNGPRHSSPGERAREAIDYSLDKARSVLNQDERKKIYLDLMKTVADDAPWIYINFEPAFELHTPRVQNYQLVADAIIRLESVWLK